VAYLFNIVNEPQITVYLVGVGNAIGSC